MAKVITLLTRLSFLDMENFFGERLQHIGPLGLPKLRRQVVSASLASFSRIAESTFPSTF
jgi:hypothetical protein